MAKYVKKIFTSSGTWTAPAGVTNITIWGRGGTGGGAVEVVEAVETVPTAAVVAAEWGSGGQAPSMMYLATVVPGTTYTITIGAAGTAGTGGAVSTFTSDGHNGTAGGNGGNSSFGTIVNFMGTSGGSVEVPVMRPTEMVVVIARWLGVFTTTPGTSGAGGTGGPGCGWKSSGWGSKCGCRFSFLFRKFWRSWWIWWRN